MLFIARESNTGLQNHFVCRVAFRDIANILNQFKDKNKESIFDAAVDMLNHTVLPEHEPCETLVSVSLCMSYMPYSIVIRTSSVSPGQYDELGYYNCVDCSISYEIIISHPTEERLMKGLFGEKTTIYLCGTRSAKTCEDKEIDMQFSYDNLLEKGEL